MSASICAQALQQHSDSFYKLAAQLAAVGGRGRCRARGFSGTGYSTHVMTASAVVATAALVYALLPLVAGLRRRLRSRGLALRG
eukprot:364825-Chlamydomonas_euryale.AAC.3